MSNKIIALVGPTASGKSSLAIELAKRFKGEVISADSRQVYKGMDIGTGKITKREMRGIPHHLLDVTSPKKVFTVTEYQKLAKQALQKIFKKNKLPIVCGGTGFYVDALLYNYELPEVPPQKILRKKLEQLSTEKLFKKLSDLDPDRAASIDRYNRRRLVRALEIAITTNRVSPPPPPKISPYLVLKLGIRLESQKLKENIERRLTTRLKQGMVREISRLHQRGVSWKKLDDFGLEYRYVGRFLQGQISKKEMIELLEKEIGRYAKRQMTWFKRDKEIHWIKNKNEAVRLVRNFIK